MSALAVPVGRHMEKQDEVKRKLGQLTAPLGLAKMPMRAGLLKDAVRHLSLYFKLCLTHAIVVLTGRP